MSKLTTALLSIAIVSMSAYFYGNEKANEGKHYYGHLYETGERNFYNGEVLLPDNVHSDTLIVQYADFLNRMIINDEYDVRSWGDIKDLLRVGCKKAN